MKTPLISRRNFVYKPSLMQQHVKGESMTVPDESFTIQEILEKFTRGVDPYLSKLPQPDDGLDVDDYAFNPKDLTDIEEAQRFVTDTNEKLKQAKKRLEELKKTDQNKE